MRGGGADILAVGMVSSVGLSAPITAAAVQADINRFQETSILNRQFRPQVMALVAGADLPPLSPSVAAAAPDMTTRQARMLRLGGMALGECLKDAPQTAAVPVLLGAPEALPLNRPAPAGPVFLEQLAAQADTPFDVRRSRVLPGGRAAAVTALAEAVAGLAAGRYPRVVVGGVDSFLDLYLLGTLHLEERLLTAGVMDGFVPGEGAAFLLLAPAGAARRAGLAPIARVDGAASAQEPGHRYTKDPPYRGDGLDAAFRAVFTAAPGDPVRTVYAGLNGENFFAKEWGVASMRHRKRFAEELAIEHPADCFGDTGAALGAMLLATGALALQKGLRQPRCLVWCSSDLGARGAALLRPG